MLTTCAECRTTFRVSQAQLDFRRGMVRCGRCGCVFNAYDSLLPELEAPPDDAADRTYVPPSRREPAAPSPYRPARQALGTPPDFAERSAQAPPAPPPFRSADERWEEDGGLAVGETDFPSLEEAGELRLPPLEEADTPPRRPDPTPPPLTQDARQARQAYAAAEAVTPDPDPESSDAILLSELPTRRNGRGEAASYREPLSGDGRWGRVLRRVALGGLVLCLLLLLPAQLLYFFRGELATWEPELRPWLEQACAPLGCEVPLSRDLAALRVESSALETDPEQPSHAKLQLNLSNRSNTEQEWPYLLLKLSDAGNRPVAQRAIPPAEYLPRIRNAGRGMRPMSENEIILELDIGHLSAAGFELTLAYP